jgi:hypothetical protein
METACFHGQLAFDEGGRRVVCLDCPTAWPPGPGEQEPRAIGLGRSDLRVALRLAPSLGAGGPADQTKAPPLLPIPVKR